MRRSLFTSLLLFVVAPPVAAERLVVSEPTRDGLVFGRVEVDDAAPATARAQSRTVYLNRNGITLMPGANDARVDRSSLVSTMAVVPAWGAPPMLWSQTVTCLRELFAPFDVAITETDPGKVPHIEAVFGGQPADLGMPAKMAGVSPFSSTCKVIENSIVFTFTEVIPDDAQIACEIMAQEIAHSYGLDHEMLAADPLTYLPYTGKRSFQDQVADCGETSPRPCGLQASAPCRDRQNSYALLMERIGEAGTGDIDPPTVAITSPADRATVDAGFAITALIADDVTVKFASLAIDGEPQGSLVAEPWTFATPTDLAPGAHVIEVKATDGAHETIATIEVTVAGESEWPLAGCSSTGETGWLFCLLVVGLVAIQRRAQR